MIGVSGKKNQYHQRHAAPDESAIRTFEVGRLAGFVYIIILAVDCFFFMLLEWTMPRNQLDYVEDEDDQASEF